MTNRTGWSPDRRPGRTTSRQSPPPIGTPTGQRNLLAHAGFGGTPPTSRSWRTPASTRGAVARALREHPESAHARVRRIGLLGSHAERVSREPPRRTDRALKHQISMGVEVKPSGKRPNPARLDRFFLLAARDAARNRRLGYWWRTACSRRPSGRTEDGAALARPLRDAREQGARLPQDGAADRPLRAGRDGQHPRPDVQVAQNPAMLYFLDAQYNVKGHRTRTSPER